MKKLKSTFFATKETDKMNLKEAFSILSGKQLINIKGGDDALSPDDGLDWKNYAESTSYDRKVSYAKIR